MGKVLLMTFLLSQSIQCFCQNYFTLGTEYLKEAKYQKADSFLTLSVCNFETSNAYFNRAIARLNLNDTCGACNDFWIMSRNYLDPVSMNHFHEFCCNSVDTIFYDKEFLLSDKDNYKYYEILRWWKYANLKEGTLHRKGSHLNHMTLNQSSDIFGLINEAPTDIIAMFYINEDHKVYTLIANYKPMMKNTSEMDDIENRARLYLNSKYSNLKSSNSIDLLEVKLSFRINKQGSIENIKYLGTYPDIIIPVQEKDKIKKDVIEIASKIPQYKPVKIGHEFVFYEEILTLEF